MRIRLRLANTVESFARARELRPMQFAHDGISESTFPRDLST
jgi:hypothetical protein